MVRMQVGGDIFAGAIKSDVILTRPPLLSCKVVWLVSAPDVLNEIVRPCFNLRSVFNEDKSSRVLTDAFTLSLLHGRQLKNFYCEDSDYDDPHSEVYSQGTVTDPTIPVCAMMTFSFDNGLVWYDSLFFGDELILLLDGKGGNKHPVLALEGRPLHRLHLVGSQLHSPSDFIKDATKETLTEVCLQCSYTLDEAIELVATLPALRALVLVNPHFSPILVDKGLQPEHQGRCEIVEARTEIDLGW